MADYTNRLEVTANIVDPITKTISVYPVKDAYLPEEEPVTPHGIQNTLLLNYSKPGDGTYNKIIMAFDVPKLKDPQYENLISVELILQATKTPRRNVNIGFKYHTDNGWVEDGTTYLGQPQDEDNFIQMKSLGAQERVLRYDITDLFKSHNNTEFHFPITIMEQETGVTGSKVIFYSRETGKKYSPVINITYAYFAEMMDTVKLDSKVTVRRHVPNKYEPYPFIPGKLNIEGGTVSTDLDSTIYIKSYRAYLNNALNDFESPYQPDDPAAPYYPGDSEQEEFYPAIDLEGQLGVMKNSYSFLLGRVNVRSENDQDGRVDVNIYVTRKRLPSDGRWVRTCDDEDPDHRANDPADLEGHIALKSWHCTLNNDNPDSPAVYHPSPLDDEANTYEPAVSLAGQINVAYFPKLDGKIVIPAFHADDGDSGPDGVDENGVPHVHVPSHNLNGRINIMQEGPEIELLGSLAIPKYHADDGDSGSDDVDENGVPHVHVPSHGQDAKVVVQRNVPNEEEDAPDLEGQVYVRWRRAWVNNALMTFSKPYKVTNTNDPFYPGDTDQNDYYPAIDLEGSVKVFVPPDLNGQITIQWKEGNEDLNAQVNVIGHRDDDLEGRVIIPKYDDLNGYIKTRERKMKDLEGKLNIDDASSGAYAFIIE